MLRNKLIILVLLATFSFSCNKRTNEGKNPSTTGSVEIKAVDRMVVQKPKKVPAQSNPVVASTNSRTPKRLNEYTESLSEIFEKLDKAPQIFSVATNKDTTLICEEGTIVKIKAKSFVAEKSGNEIRGNIRISIKEYYKLSDILLAKLSTTSNGNILETGGMIYITASVDNENCVLKKGQNIEIEFPRKTEKAGMQLYTGSWQNDFKINWNLYNDNGALYTVVEQMPTFRGGDIARIKYLNENIKYPQLAKKNGIQGTVYLAFIIDISGRVSDVKVLRGIGGGCDEEAVRIVKMMPPWNPGKQSGIPANVQFSMPIRFTLDGNYDTTKYARGIDNFETYYNDTTIQNAEINDIKFYLFSTSKLGWINCDRLWKNNSPTINYLVNVGRGGYQSTLNIVFHSYKSVLSGFSNTNNYSFTGIPPGEEITLVVVKRMDDRLLMATKETRTSTVTENGLVFQPVTMESLKAEMQKLDGSAEVD